MSWEDFKIEVTRDGMWPFPWRWSVERRKNYKFTFRNGEALTKDRARRKAVHAMRSMERDDVEITVE